MSIESELDRTTTTRVGNCLLYGLLLSTAVMLFGFLFLSVKGESAPSHVLSLDKLPGSLSALDAGAILDLGILLLFATPLAGVVVALEEFLRVGDRAFALIAFVLLILLGAGFVIAFQ
jgi:uncharacterized membrane protein